jgi:hypothetical protein
MMDEAGYQCPCFVCTKKRRGQTVDALGTACLRHPVQLDSMVGTTYAPLASRDTYGAITDPKKAFGDAKLPLQIVPPLATAFIALGLAEGAKKYGPWNWRSTNVEVMTYIGGVKRHLDAFIEGEDIDPDSAEGKPHLAGAIASLAILIDALEGGFAIDNRPPPNAGMLRRLNQGAANADAKAKSD